MKNFKNLLVVALFFAVATVFGQSKVEGKVVDDSGQPLPSASVQIKGTSNGTSTDFDGKFVLNASTSSGVVSISFIGYQTVEISFSAAKMNLGTIQLNENANTLTEVVVVGKGVIDLAGGRKTPVAVNTIKAAEIQSKIGAQDVTMTLVNTPSVYVAGAAGGFGDSRINVRGFGQDNTAYMLNGQPINGMEDGKMYWSNWSGINDIASAIQIQRGLGASKLAISSVGGTVNFVTKTTDRTRKGYASATFANDAYMKTTFSYSTGKLENNMGVSVMLSHWQGDGYNDGTKGQGQTYFVSFGYTPNERHNFNFLITGAPQWHDQNFASSISTYLANGKKYNGNWGTYKGEYMSERRNFYHKPIINLNWDYTIDEDTSLSTVLYGSFGRGGGTGNLGKRINNNANGQIDYDAIYAHNATIAGGAATNFGANQGYITRSSMNMHSWFGLVSNYTKKLSENLSFNVGMDLRTYYGEHYRVVENFRGLTSWKEDIRLRDQNNGHATYGTFGTYKFVQTSKSLNADPYAATWASFDQKDKIGYSNDERISYGGIFTQLEYSKDKFSVFFQGALSNQWHQRFDHYQYASQALIDGTSPQGNGTPLPANIKAGVDSEKVSNMGYNLKVGGSYEFNENNTVYFNTGYYNRQPYHDNIYLNNTNQINPYTSNEKIFGLEAGYALTGETFSANVNVYRTSWKDRVTTSSTVNGAGLVTFRTNQGVEQLHQGVEIDMVYKVMNNLRVKGFVSLGDWTYKGSSIQRSIDENNVVTAPDVLVDVDGGKVGDAAQTSGGLGLDYRITKSLSMDLDYRYYSNLYANTGAVKTNLELPSYSLADFGVSYRMFLGADKTNSLNFRMNVNNLFDTEYLSDSRTNIAADGSNPTYKGIDVRNQVYFGYGRTWNVGLTYKF